MISCYLKLLPVVAALFTLIFGVGCAHHGGKQVASNSRLQKIFNRVDTVAARAKEDPGEDRFAQSEFDGELAVGAIAIASEHPSGNDDAIAVTVNGVVMPPYSGITEPDSITLDDEAPAVIEAEVMPAGLKEETNVLGSPLGVLEFGGGSDMRDNDDAVYDQFIDGSEPASEWQQMIMTLRPFSNRGLLEN